ncbi:hypothetical protein DFH11DRAFT_1724079 [Phellopilus nigrolimitatus]|nr:hypothetical protein DFH11DRAFT_1724079 [Phellopilus nigrolimitatus]
MKGRRDSKEGVFFQTQLGIYSACLLLANLLSGVAGLIGFLWVKRDGIVTGRGCTTQGSLIQIGDVAGAFFTAVIATHTFQTLVMHMRYPTWVILLTIAFGWGSAVATATVITIITTHMHGPFFNSVGMWCAISSGYTIEQFAAYYLPIVLSALVTATLYALIYLCLRGTLVIGNGIKLNISPENAQGWAGRLNGREEYRHFLGAIVKSLLWLPFTFIILFLPITIAGLMRISGINNSDALLAFAGICASLTGLANVLVLYNTLRILRPAISPGIETKSSESFFTAEERKASPIEAPNPSRIGAPMPLMHGQAFPRPPGSRLDSPLSSTRFAYDIPTAPKSGRASTHVDDQASKHASTPQIMHPWIRHQHSSSIESTSYLMRAPTPRSQGHSRDSSTATFSEIPSSIGKPIVSNANLTGYFDGDLSSFPRHPRTTSPALAFPISRPITPVTAGLPPAPRPVGGDHRSRVFSRTTSPAPGLFISRATTPGPAAALSLPSSLRPERRKQSLLNVVVNPPHQPISISPSDSNRVEHDLVEENPTTREPEQRSPTKSHSGHHTPSTPLTMFSEHEDYEIHQVDSRDRLRPAVSAVAHMPSAVYRFPAKGALASAESLPESVSIYSVATESLSSSVREDSLHAEMRARRDTPNEGVLSSIAWASLVPHAAVRSRFPSEATLRSPVDADEEFTPSNRRVSDIPMILQPGTPGSSGANMYFGFHALGPSARSQLLSARDETVQKPSLL